MYEQDETTDYDVEDGNCETLATSHWQQMTNSWCLSRSLTSTCY